MLFKEYNDKRSKREKTTKKTSKNKTNGNNKKKKRKQNNTKQQQIENKRNELIYLKYSSLNISTTKYKYIHKNTYSV